MRSSSSGGARAQGSPSPPRGWCLATPSILGRIPVNGQVWGWEEVGLEVIPCVSCSGHLGAAGEEGPAGRSSLRLWKGLGEPGSRAECGGRTAPGSCLSLPAFPGKPELVRGRWERAGLEPLAGAGGAVGRERLLPAWSPRLLLGCPGITGSRNPWGLESPPGPRSPALAALSPRGIFPGSPSAPNEKRSSLPALPLGLRSRFRLSPHGSLGLGCKSRRDGLPGPGPALQTNPARAGAGGLLKPFPLFSWRDGSLLPATAGREGRGLGRQRDVDLCCWKNTSGRLE